MSVNRTSQPANNAIKPDAPTSVSASATSGGNATVSFTASTNPGKGSGNYVATSSPGSITGSASSSPISITGLTNGTAYTFTVVKQSGTGISSDSSAASGSITAYSAPIFGTQSGSSTPTDPSVSSTGKNSVSTTTANLTSSIGSGATFYGYKDVDTETTTYAGSATGGGSNEYQLTGLSQKTTYNYRVVVYNTNSAQSLITRVTPNGSATTVSVEYGNSMSYGSNATVSSGSANIGSGTSEVSTTWSLGSSSSATIYYRVTATYAGGATVQTTGSISRSVRYYNGGYYTSNPSALFPSQWTSSGTTWTTSSDYFTTYGTYSYTNDASSLAVYKPSYGVNISSISVTLVGGGGGGTSNGGGGAGGGGGGRLVASSGLTSSGNLSITRGGGGAVNGYGGTTSFTYSAATLYADGGTPAVGAQGGASPLGGGSYNYGYVGNSLVGGGGGGAGGAATDVNGGPASSGVGPGGPGYYNVPYSGAGWGAWGSGGSSSSVGAGGRGGYDNPSATGGNNGYWSITYVGPARS
jgi:hypothetical protein